MCLCECGNRTNATTVHLKHGNKRSCGCLVKDEGRKRRGMKYKRKTVKSTSTTKNPKKRKVRSNKRTVRKSIPKSLDGVKSKIVQDGLFRIFENGRVFRINESGFVECSHIDTNGYTTVTGFVNGKQKHFYLHRLLAEAFIPNPDPKNYSIVSFKDDDTGNVSIDNLEWTSHGRIIKKAHENGAYELHKNPCVKCRSKTRTKDRICTKCKLEIAKEEKRLKREQRKKDSVAYLMENIDLLTKTQRRVVELRFKGKTFEEIGKINGTSKQAVENTVKVANKRIERIKLKNDLAKKEKLEREKLIKEKAKEMTNEKLFILRNTHDFTIADMAELLNISTTTYRNKEIGKNEFTISEAIKVADLFDMSVEDLFVK